MLYTSYMVQAAASGGDSKEPEQKDALWHKKNEAVVEQEFQKDLEVCCNTDIHANTSTSSMVKLCNSVHNLL